MDDFSQALASLKEGFDAVRAAVGLARDVKQLTQASKKESEAIDEAIGQAETSIKVAEAKLAQALGYELCRCAFPPTPMLKIGYYHERGSDQKILNVYECPRCKSTNAGGNMFQRTVGE
jgi:hypothetical protein